MSGYIGNIPVPQSTQTRDNFTATDGQTTFSTSGYTPSYLDVYLNGIHLDPSDYTATNGTDVVLASGATVGDVVTVVAYTTFEVADQAFSGDFSVDGSTFVVDSANDKVGIGTSSPAQKLDVNGSINVSSAGNIFTASTSGIFMNGSGSYDVGIYNDNTGVLRFNTNNTERMRIDSSGRLMLGVTSSSASSHGIVVAQGIRGRAGIGGSESNTFNIQWTGSPVLWIDTTNVGTLATTSDYRTKRNIITQEQPALERIAQLRPVIYQRADYKDLFAADDEVREGFIAHELQAVIPSAVEGEKDDENQIQSLKLDALCSVLVKGIQEQQEVIEDLKARIEVLEGASA